MSFSNLISGADCGPINPLAQVLKHTEGDRSLQRVRRARFSPQFMVLTRFYFYSN